MQLMHEVLYVVGHVLVVICQNCSNTSKCVRSCAKVHISNRN